MPLTVEEPGQPRVPRDFTLALTAPNPNQPADPVEARCRDRVNEYVTYLAGIPTDNTPRGEELINLRNEYVSLFRDRADELINHRLTAEELLYTSYVYEGEFGIKVQHLVDAIIFVSAAQSEDDLLRVDFDISQGTTTPDQAEIVRSIKETQVVVDVALKRPLLRWRRGRWRARRNYYVEELVSIGRIGLTEGNIDLAKGNIASLQREFLAQRAEAVKNRYVRRLGFWALLWILINAAAYVLVCRYLGPSVRGVVTDNSFDFLADIAWRFRNFFLLAIGSALGAWLAFLIQRPTMAFTDLVQLDDNLLRPSMRVIFTIVLGTVVGLLFWTGMILISIGGFTTNFHNAGTPAMVIGAFCGIASAAIAAAVSSRAREFATGLGGQTPQAGQK